MLEVALRNIPVVERSASCHLKSVNVINALLKAKQGAVSGKEMAGIIGRSHRQSSEIYHRVAGETFRNARLRARLIPSATFVRGTSLSIDLIAARFGYGSRVKFDQSYEKVFGVTPSADRLAAQQTEARKPPFRE
jgi:transcriptional regulator GlxA family with amidase domain